MEEKGVHFLGLYRLRGKERWKLGFDVRLGNLRATYPTTVYLKLA
jgi:hypothetical protein